MLSDHNEEVVQRLAANIELNRASLLRSCAHVSAENLDWHDFLVGSTGGARVPAATNQSSGVIGAGVDTCSISEPLLCTKRVGQFRILLGADVVYSTEAVDMLMAGTHPGVRSCLFMFTSCSHVHGHG